MDFFRKRFSLSSLEISMYSSQLYASRGTESLKCAYRAGLKAYVCAGMFWEALGFVEFPELATFYSPEAPAIVDPVFEGTAQP